MKLRACAEIVRPINSLMIGFAVLVGIALANSGRIPGADILVPAYLTGFFISSASMVLNDIVDVEIDRVNAPQRPLPSGRLSVREAYACYAALSLAGLASSAMINLYTFLIALVSWVIATSYDLFGKRSGLLGNLMVAYSVAVPIIFGAACVRRFSQVIWVYYFMIFMTALAREIAKDIADVEGDRLAGVKSLAIVKGPRFAAGVAAALYLLAVSASPVPVLKGLVNSLAYGLPVLVVDVGLVYDSLVILRGQDRERILAHKRRVLMYMLIGLVGFYLGVWLA